MPYRILSLDGGGIRGLITAVWLHHLERKLGSPLRGHFDLVAGTSTGSMLACAVSHGVSTARMVEVYLQRGREVFPSLRMRWWERLIRSFEQGISAPRYNGAGLNRVLRDVFGDLEFGALGLKPTLAVSYNTQAREAVVLKNTRERFRTLPVWEVCRASASAPSYFPAHIVPLEDDQLPLIDGAVVANNPTVCAIAEGVRCNARPREGRPGLRLQQFVVASFGTGSSGRGISAAQAREWGGLQWALPIVDVLMDGAGDAAHYIASQILPAEQYFRFQCSLPDSLAGLDNAEPANLSGLLSAADAHLSHSAVEQQFDKLCDLLTCGKGPILAGQCNRAEAHDPLFLRQLQQVFRRRPSGIQKKAA